MAGGVIADTGRSVFVGAPDGLRLHVREYGSSRSPATPVVCLPGLTRTVADFDALAPALADAGSRRVLAIDSRGRGQSEYDRNPENYNLLVEIADVIAVLTALSVGPAIFVGSSRGGLLAMHLAVAHPTTIAGIVLHDIGPVIEPKGLVRIRSYVGKMMQPRSFTEGAEILRRLSSSQFPNLTPEQWLAAAQRAWQERDGAMVPTYDVDWRARLRPSILNSVCRRCGTNSMRWRACPCWSSAALTLTFCRRKHSPPWRRAIPGMESIEVPDQGHVPLLEGDLAARVIQFVTACDHAQSIAGGGKRRQLIATPRPDRPWLAESC